MGWLFSLIRQNLHVRRMRRKFPLARIHDRVSLGGECVIGEYATLFADVKLWESVLGRYSYIQSDSMCNNAQIGPFCSIASNVIIGLAAHPTTMVSTSPVFYDNTQPLPRSFSDSKLFSQNLPRTYVGADVWIGQGALIKSGVSIGVGAVIGAGSIVTRDVAPYSIVAGNPARLIRSRFSAECSAQLLQTQWWTMEDDVLRSLAPMFSDISSFLASQEVRL